jgi:uncharacterized protein
MEFLIVVFIIIASYIILCCILYFRQSGILYVPKADICAYPSDFGLQYENVQLNTSDGETLASWFLPHPRERFTVLICHGNGGNIGDRRYTMEFFYNLECNQLIFDYRGYGNSSGKPSEQGTYLDSIAAYDYLVNTKKTAPEKIIVFGRSLGGAIAVWLALKKKVAGIIIESTFISLAAIGKQKYPFFPVQFLAKYSYNTLQRMPEIYCPVLVAHSREDNTVPFSFSEQLFKAVNSPKLFAELIGEHNDWDNFHNESYKQTVKQFFEMIETMQVV